MKTFYCTLILLLYIAEAFAQAPDKAIHLADPTIFYEAGTYYLYGTGSPNGFPVYTSKDLKNWEPHQTLALTRGDSYGTKGFWAPQVFKHNSKYYMAYTANEHIAIASSDDPLGPFKQVIIKPITMAGRQIDPYIFKDTNGQFYLYHVRLQNGNRIFVNKFNNDLSDVADSTGTECISAVEPWENTANAQWPVTEGPTVIKQGKTYYLFYSANDFRNINYAVGYATATSPTGPWKRSTGNPIISRQNTGRNGSGHGDLLTDDKGKLWYVLHTHNDETKVERRKTAIVQLKFTKGKYALVPDSFRYLEDAASK